MKELNNKKVYQCEYCSRVSLNKGGIKTHEHYCKHNPNKQTPCASCKHLIKSVKEREIDMSRCCGCPHHYFEWILAILNAQEVSVINHPRRLHLLVK